jgi:hypothetical protein
MCRLRLGAFISAPSIVQGLLQGYSVGRIGDYQCPACEYFIELVYQFMPSVLKDGSALVFVLDNNDEPSFGLALNLLEHPSDCSDAIPSWKAEMEARPAEKIDGMDLFVIA